MAEQTFTLAAGDLFRDTSSQKQWRVSVQLDADFEPGPTDRYFRRLIVRNDQGPSNFQYQMSFDETGVAPNSETASQLVDEWAEADVALTFAQGSNTLDVPGPNNADNEVQDATDNYTWAPSADQVSPADSFFFSLFDSSADLTVTFKFPGPDTSPTLGAVADQSATIGVPFSLTLDAATGGNAPLTYTAAPRPAGLSFNATTRVLSGTPTTAGTTTVTYSVEDDDGDTDSVSFSFAVAALVVVPDYTLEVDWDNDGNYANADADVWGRVIEGTFSCRRGRNFASQRSGRSVAGSLEVQLDNRDGLFDPDNDTGDLSGLLASGRRVRYQMDDGAGTLVTQWTGWLRTIEQIDRHTGFDRIRLRALGVISRLNPPRAGQDQQVVVRAQETNVSTQAAARRIFDPDGSIGSADAVVDGADYRASYINGTRTMARWWADRPRLTELRDLEQTEGGFLWEPKDGFVGMDATSKRQTASAQLVQATFTDGIPAAGEIPAVADGIKPDHPREDLANIIISQVRTYGVGAQEVLWSAAAFPIAGSSDFRIIIRYPNENTGGDNVAVSSWTALQSGVDYTAQSGVTLTMTTEGNQATIRIQNTNAADTTMDIQVRGLPVVRNEPVEIISPDDDSVAEYGPEPYPFPTPWLSNPATVQVLHDILLRLYAQPAERLTMTWEVESDREQAAALDLSDRVEVMRRGILTDYFIESIRHRVTSDFHFISYTLSPAGVFGSLFVIGVSRYGEGILA